MSGSMRNRLRKNWIGYVFVSPWVIMFCIFGLWPILYAIILSLQNSRLMQKTDSLTLYNYNYLFTDSTSYLLLTMKNTAVYVMFFIPSLLFLALLLAFLLNRKLFLKGVWKTVFFFPLVTASVVYAMIWQNVLSFDGILNSFLWNLGIGELNVLKNKYMAMPAVAVVDALQQAPYWTLIIISALTSVSEELYDSAKLDGASNVQKFMKITLPMIRPVLFFMLFMASAGAWNVFEQVFVLTQGGPDNASLTLVYYLYSMFSQGRIGMSSAIGIVIGLLVLLTTLIVRRVVKVENYYN